MAPETNGNTDEKWALFNTLNGNGGEPSVEAAGIAVYLMTYSHHAMRTVCNAMTDHYYRLRDYALNHAECNVIMRPAAMEQQLPLFAHESAPADQQTVREALTVLEHRLHEPGASFTSSSSVRDWLRLQLASFDREAFNVLWLDNQNRLIAHDTLLLGTIKTSQSIRVRSSRQV